ncbi:MAG: acyl carrier protein [Proteobacteria bacterium]|nr:MAG: acyl carrier protein [Pseudomonadota bacterium]
MDIKRQVRDFILLNFLDGEGDEALADDVSLERAHIVDSARALELILFIEETFEFEVANEDATPENFDTVNTIVAYIERKMA